MMIRTFFFKYFILVGVCFISSAINAQFENKNAFVLKAEALRNFEAGNYSDAVSQYKNLLILYPKDGLYSYYCGVSLLNLNKDIPKAIEYLEFSSLNSTVPYKVFYYLGDAYTRNYQFPQAKNAYDQFIGFASKSELKELMVVRLSEMSANAIEITVSFNQVDVLASSLFIFSDTGYTRQLRSQGGYLTTKPDEFSPTSQGVKDISNLMFIPRKMGKGDLLFYAGYGKSKKHGSDIFMVKAGNGHKYSEPIPVNAVNTDFDELLPYYDPIGKDLIFASKGHNSMGGFDLFKSHYDSESNSWTPPLNLGFPINSPSDEYLMIPGIDMGKIMLVTNRQGLESMITAYMLQIREPRIRITNEDPSELKKIGNFGGIEAIPEMIDMSVQDILTDSTADTASAPIMTPSKRPKPGDEGGEIPVDYNKFLRMALNQQYIADSLSGLASEARIGLKTKTDPDERWAIQKEIISWEKGSADSQAKADEYYLIVKQMEKGTTETKKIPDAIVKDTVINDIIVYKFKQADTLAEKSKTKQLTNTVDEEPLKTPAKIVVIEPKMPEIADKEKNQFVILEKSQYSASKTFPEDINMPKGAYYKIQLAVKSEEPRWDVFGGLSPVTFETVPGKPLKKYFAGKFVNYDRAKASLEEVRRNGFPEAFIVSWYDGQKMTLNKVVELEKE